MAVYQMLYVVNDHSDLTTISLKMLNALVSFILSLVMVLVIRLNMKILTLKYSNCEMCFHH